MLRKLSAAHEKISAESVRSRVEKDRDELLERVDAQLTAWRRADQRLREAKRELDSRISPAVITAVAWVGAIAATTAVFVIAFLAVGDRNYGLLGVAGFAAYLVLPWQLLEMMRARLGRKLAVPAREMARGKAEHRFHSALLDQVTVAIREAINEALTSYSPKFRVFDVRGLKELSDPEREVATGARGELEVLMASLSSGSIGLAGPRGSGKTTLMESFARGRSVVFSQERVGLTVAAPVKYDAREFVLHLFGSLCERVIGEDRLAELSSLSWSVQNEQRRTSIARGLALAALLLALVAGAMLVLNKTAPEGPRETAIMLFAVAGLAGYVSLVLWVGGSGRGQMRLRRWMGISASDKPPPEWVAQAHLEQIRYQQTISSNWSGGIELPMGIKVGGEGGTTSSRTPWSLPEAVEAFRRYAATVAEDCYVVIGIDELDKMESGDAARQFLNNIKGVFGVRGCYYLISVSEDAMSSFERRGLPFRDVFDSSFDAIQPVGYLSLSESRTVLETRVTGLPVPFQCLCYCLSGGLPRDLIRTARELIHQQAALSEDDLGPLALAVVRAEYRGKLAAAMEAARVVHGEESEWLAGWLSQLETTSIDPGILAGHYRQVRDCPGLSDQAALEDDDSGSRVRRIAVEMAILNYYTATVLDLFGAETQFASLLRPVGQQGEIDATLAESFEGLAEARQGFSVNPWLAWRRVTAVRDAIPWLEPWEDPRVELLTQHGNGGALG